MAPGSPGADFGGGIVSALRRQSQDSAGVTLYQANLRTYSLLRYGVPVQVAVGQAHETVHLID